jgi:lysophospholipase L1-like esterase
MRTLLNSGRGICNWHFWSVAIMTNNDTQHKTWEWVAIGYIIALHLFSAMLIVKTDFIPKVKAKLGLAPTPYVLNMLKYHQWIDDSVPDHATIFLGDSITQGLATAAVAPSSVNYGIGGETTAQLLGVMSSYKSLSRADAIFLNIGVNDLAQGRKEGLSDRYRKILQALPSKATLIWSAVMPVRSKKIALSDVDCINHTIRSLCSNRGNCVFVDTWKLLADKNGQMNKSLFLHDGLHLSPAGYRAWIPALKQAIQHLPSANAQPLMPEDLAR